MFKSVSIIFFFLWMMGSILSMSVFAKINEQNTGNKLEQFEDYFFDQTPPIEDKYSYKDDHEDDNNQLSEQYQQYFNNSGAHELYDSLSESTKDMLKQLGIEHIDEKTLMQLEFKTLLSLIMNQVFASFKKPLLLFSIMMGMVLLASFMGLLRTTTQHTVESVFTVVAVLSIAGVMITPIVELIQHTVLLIDQINRFMLGFIPVYTGIVAASGKPVSAFTYNTMLMSITQMISYLLTHILIPVIGVYLALTVMGATTNQINVGSITKSIRSGLLWCLGFFLTIFVALLTIRSFVAGATDTVAFRTGKFVVSSVIPVVGGAVGESLSVVQGSLGIIRNTVGAFGIVALLVMFLAPIIELLFMRMALMVTQNVSEMLGVESVGKLLESAQFVLSILLAVVVLFAVMLIVSIGLIVIMGNMT